MDQMDSLEFEITSCIQNAGKKDLLCKISFILVNYKNSQRIPWQPVASVTFQGIIGNVNTSSSSLGYSHADIGSIDCNKYSANYGGH